MFGYTDKIVCLINKKKIYSILKNYECLWMLRSTIDANYVITFKVKNNIYYYEFMFKPYSKTIDYFTLIIN